MVLLVMVCTFVPLIVGPLLSAPSNEQAKVDTVQSAALALYRMQRDLRQSDPSGVFACTYPGPSTCSVLTPDMTSTPVIAIMTTRTNGTGQSQWETAKGQPQWTGFNVYWLVPNGQGSNTLKYAFGSANLPPGSPSPGLATVNSAVNTALTSASPLTVALAIADMQTNVNVTRNTVGLWLSARSRVNGRTNETSYRSDTYARN